MKTTGGGGGLEHHHKLHGGPWFERISNGRKNLKAIFTVVKRVTRNHIWHNSNAM